MATTTPASAGTVQSDNAPPGPLMIGIAALLVLLILAGGAIARVASQKSKPAPRPYGRHGRTDDSGAYPYDARANQRQYEYDQRDTRSGSRSDDERWQDDPVRSGAHGRPQSGYRPNDASRDARDDSPHWPR